MQNLELNDFYSSAYLITIGFELMDIYKVGSQSTFVFEGSDEAREELSKFYTMAATVNAAKYAQEVKKLKTIIHRDIKFKSEINSYGKEQYL